MMINNCHMIRDGVYKQARKKIKDSYSVKVSGYDRKRVIWEVVDNNVFGDITQK